MRIICMACPPGAPEIEEKKYAEHMETVHSGSQKNARIKEQNLPPLPPEGPSNLPPGINPGDLPSQEFMELAKEIDNAQKTPPPPQPSNSAPQVIKNQPKTEPLKLKYVWQGVCPNCNTPVRTIMVKVEGKLFCAAYCLTHEQIETREVHPLEKPVMEYEGKIDEVVTKKSSRFFKRKEANKNGNIRGVTPLQGKVQPVSETRKPGV